MIELHDRRAFADVSIIINMMSKSMRDKIDPEFIKFIEENKDVKYISNIKTNIPIMNQNIEQNTQTILAFIYREYICSSIERKELLIEKRKKEVEKYNKNKEKYQINFKSREKKKIIKENSIIVYKKNNIFIKIINYIRRLFSN